MSKKQLLNQSSYTACGNNPKFKASNMTKINMCQYDNAMNSKGKHLRQNMSKQCSSQKENWISEFKQVHVINKIMAKKHKDSTKITYYNDYKYFQQPIVPFLISKPQNMDISIQFSHDILSDVVTNAQKQCYVFSPKAQPYKNVETQTDYRDSESQTIPWEPPYEIKSGHKPETLTIAHLTWNHGSEIGIHDIEIINRLRKKKEWEAVLPPIDTPANIRKRLTIINTLEIDEWAFREAEIAAIMDYRFELMDEISKSHELEKEQRLQGRFDRLRTFLLERRNREIHSVKHNLRRELRKLHKKHYEKQQPFKQDITKKYADLSSEFYAPQMRYGEHPQRRHEVIKKELLGEKYIECATEISTLPISLSIHEELDAIKLKPKPADLCVRQTRWTKEKLSQLYSDLKAVRFCINTIRAPLLLNPKYRLPPLPPIPCRTNTENMTNTNVDQLSAFIQRIIRGRAVQCMMFEGRNRCRELIEELQSSYGLEEQSKKRHQKEKKRTLKLQQLQSEKSMQEDHLCEILNSLEGITISAMLDFLSKELTRLEDERRVHAFALLAERERAMREAAEAGRRQLECNRRREFDEMFRQIIKVNQESVECYLEDIIKEGIEWVSNEATKAYIMELCDKVDSICESVQDNAPKLVEEELVANMIYNFVLPEVEKSTIRKNIREKQQAYLQNAHTAIYTEILNLPYVGDSKLLQEKDKQNLTAGLDNTKLLETCSTIYVAQSELKTTQVTSLNDVETTIDSIISNIDSII